MIWVFLTAISMTAQALFIVLLGIHFIKLSSVNACAIIYFSGALNVCFLIKLYKEASKRNVIVNNLLKHKRK